jgi:two-component system chemotaxis response regulator CheB
MSTDAPHADVARRIRVLVVDDSPVQRGWLISLGGNDQSLEVVGWAADGHSAIREAARLRPDVITMDLGMPGMDGLEATRHIMHHTPTPIVLVTARATGTDRHLIAEALKAGVLAIEVKSPDAEGVRELLETIKGMSRVLVVRRSSPGDNRRPAAIQTVHRPVDVIVIGASTGGPQALHEILTVVPATFSVPIVIVQHLAAGFTQNLVDWLAGACALPVSLAQHGRHLSGGGVHVAPTGHDITIAERTLWLTPGPTKRMHCPSINVLFQSVAVDYRGVAIGVLLTGMGDDGAAGLAQLKQAGAITIAQDEASSIVFGMPKAAANLGVVDHVLPPARVAELLSALVGRERRS